MDYNQALDVLDSIADFYPKFEVTRKKASILIPQLEVTRKKASILIPQLERMDYQGVMKKLAAYVAEYPYPPLIAEIAVYPPEENQQLVLMKQWQEEAAKVPFEIKKQFQEQLSKLLKEQDPHDAPQ